MGGTNEQILNQPVNAAQPSGTPALPPIRFHENNGEFHFHDDTNNRKVAIPVAELSNKYRTWIKNPNSPELTHIDQKNNSLLTIKIVTIGQEMNAEIQVKEAKIGDVLRKLNDVLLG